MLSPQMPAVDAKFCIFKLRSDSQAGRHGRHLGIDARLFLKARICLPKHLEGGPFESSGAPW
jgi:hypothetical protein